MFERQIARLTDIEEKMRWIENDVAEVTAKKTRIELHKEALKRRFDPDADPAEKYYIAKREGDHITLKQLVFHEPHREDPAFMVRFISSAVS
jgi:hypothetical protein